MDMSNNRARLVYRLSDGSVVEIYNSGTYLTWAYGCTWTYPLHDVLVTQMTGKGDSDGTAL